MGRPEAYAGILRYAAMGQAAVMAAAVSVLKDIGRLARDFRGTRSQKAALEAEGMEDDALAAAVLGHGKHGQSVTLAVLM